MKFLPYCGRLKAMKSCLTCIVANEIGGNTGSSRHMGTPRMYVQVYALAGTELSLQQELEKAKPFKCCSFGSSSLVDRHLATGSFAGRLQLWDLDRPERPVYDA